MRHTVYLLLGSDLEQVGKGLKKYVAKYGEGGASSYFNVVCWDLRTDGSVQIKTAELCQHNDEELFCSSLENLYQVNLLERENLKTIEDMKSFFSRLYTRIVTINNPGDSNSLQICLFIPLYDRQLWLQAQTIIELLNDGIQQQYSIDLMGLAADMSFLFSKGEGSNELSTNLLTMKEIVGDIVRLKERSTRISHFILMQNCNAQGIALNLDNESFVRIIGELSLLCVEHYAILFPIAADFSEQNIITFGLSVLNFDKYYFVHYLIRHAYLHVLERENVMQTEVDVNKVSQIVQTQLEKHTHLVSDFYQTEISLLVKNGKSPDEIISEITPKLDESMKKVVDDLQSFIYNETLTLPEKQAALAQMLGLDDDLLTGNMFNKKQLTIDDCESEAVNVFIQENNKQIVRTQNEEGEVQVIPGVLNAPEDSAKNIFLPLKEIKSLRVKIRESTSYIRQKSKELDLLSKQLQNNHICKKRLTESGFVCEEVTYKLLNIDEKPLTSTYIAHQVLERNIDLRSGFPGIKNQGGQGDCSVFSVSSICEYILKKSALSEYDLSEAFVYYNMRKKENKIGEDSGSSLYAVLNDVFKEGICKFELFPYNSNDYCEEPPLVAYEDAKQRLVKEAKNVRLRISDFKSALMDGYPIAVSIKIYNSFGENENGFIFCPSDDEIKGEKYGNHAMVVCGYSDDERVFIVRNSWGKQFGDKGYCYIPYSYMENSSLVNMACIITQISDSVKVEGLERRTTVSFDKTDVNIRCSIIHILIDEEKHLLKQNQQIYAGHRIAYDTLVQTLGNNSIREEIGERAYERLNEEAKEQKMQEYNLINLERPRRLAEYDAKTSMVKSWIIAVILLLSIACGISFYYSSIEDQFLESVTWGILVGIVLLSMITSFYLPHRKHYRLKLDEELSEQVKCMASKYEKLQMEQSNIRLQLHLAGMIIDRLAILQSNLVQRYHSLKSYVGNLSTWYREEDAEVKEMTSVMKEPFISLLSNEFLDKYFEKEKEVITSNIKLYSYFESYSLDENTIRAYKNNIKRQLIDQLFNRLEGFTVFRYITGDRIYPYLETKYASIPELLPLLDVKSAVFLQNEKLQVKDMAQISRNLFIHTDVQSEHSVWGCEYPKYFQTKPSCNTMESIFKLIVFQEKRLDVKDIRMLNL